MAATTGEVIHPSRDDYLQVVAGLKDEGFEMCVDVCGVDYLSHRGRTLPPEVHPERFEVVVNLVSLEHRRPSCSNTPRNVRSGSDNPPVSRRRRASSWRTLKSLRSEKVISL